MKIKGDCYGGVLWDVNGHRKNSYPLISCNRKSYDF